MTIQVAVIGIDGSGKSTLARALPMFLSAEQRVVAGAAGNEFWVFGPDQEHLAPGFHPRGLPLAAGVSRACRRLAKRLTSKPGLYPYFKLAHLMFQDDAAVAIGRRYSCDVVVSDCNLLLSAMGRAANYRRAAERDGEPRPRSTVEDLVAVFRHLMDGAELPAGSAGRLPSLDAASMVARLARILGFDGVWLPDVVLFLDVDPAIALARIKGGGAPLDRHENEPDMGHARETYLKALRALEVYTGRPCVHVIDTNDAEPREVLAHALAVLGPHIAAGRPNKGAEVLGTPGGDVARKALRPGYLLRYLVGKFFQGAWREPLFLLSPMGRMLVREGYSAGVMRVIYDQDAMPHGPLDRAFLDYPLHRAVYDRLQILTRSVQSELLWRLELQPRVRIFTAPSGFCYDVFRPLEAIAASRPELMRKIELVAVDLDPHRVLADELEPRARRLGIDFRFLVGDITSEATWRECSAPGPFDIALFVGLSSWLPRAQAMTHLRRLASGLGPDGLLVTDCFMAAAYSLGGRYMGYRAHYYSPWLYRRMLEHCGFDGATTEVESGRDRINHVLISEAAQRPAWDGYGLRQAAPSQSLASHR